MSRRKNDMPIPHPAPMAGFLVLAVILAAGDAYLNRDDSEVLLAENVGPYEYVDIWLHTSAGDGTTVVDLNAPGDRQHRAAEVSIVGVDGTRLGGREYQPPPGSQQEIQVEVTWDPIEEPGWLPWESTFRETPPTVTATATLTRPIEGKATLTEGPPAATSVEPVGRSAQSMSFRLDAAGSVQPVQPVPPAAPRLQAPSAGQAR